MVIFNFISIAQSLVLTFYITICQFWTVVLSIFFTLSIVFVKFTLSVAIFQSLAASVQKPYFATIVFASAFYSLSGPCLNVLYCLMGILYSL